MTRLGVLRALLAGTIGLVLAVAPSAHGSYIDSSGTREWAIPASTLNHTWYEIRNVCYLDGVTPCDGSLTPNIGFDDAYTGWIWATHDQALALMGEVTGQGAAITGDEVEIDSAQDWARTAIALLGGPTGINDPSPGNYWERITALVSTTVPGISAQAMEIMWCDGRPNTLTNYCRSTVGGAENDFVSTAYFNGPQGFIRYTSMGALFYKPVEYAGSVPEPATFALIGLGLVGIAASRRRRLG
jgi:hypothetical protein